MDLLKLEVLKLFAVEGGKEKISIFLVRKGDKH